jgi:D-3-phosphoglycerate dehydrogenase
MHKNVPNMLTQITTAFSRENVNIDNLANGSKGEVAYTIVETEKTVEDTVLQTVKAIEGVIAVNCY